MRALLRSLPFVLISLDADQGGGSGSSDPAPPEPTGDTLENKLTSAKGIIANFFKSIADLTSQLSTSKNEVTRLTQQFDSATQTATNEQTEHTKTKGLLSTANTTITGLTTERDNANKNVERLEKLCGLNGIDPKQAVTVEQADQTKTPGGLWEQYENLKKREAKGEVKAGVAMAFYRDFKSELRKFSDSKR